MSKSRKSTPDILGQVMGDDAENNRKAIKPVSNKTVKLDSGEAVKLENRNYKDQKEKATFNLSLSILDKLEDATITLKRAKRGTRITKTLLVEKALEIALKDLEKNGEESYIFKNT